jgi:hypothetical protein
MDENMEIFQLIDPMQYSKNNSCFGEPIQV